MLSLTLDPQDMPDPEGRGPADYPELFEENWDNTVPMESAGVLRMFRTRRPVTQLAEVLRIQPDEFAGRLRCAFDEETAANEDGRPIYDALVPKGYRAE